MRVDNAGLLPSRAVSPPHLPAQPAAPLGLACLSVVYAEPAGELVEELQQLFGGKLIANAGFAGPSGSAAGVAKLIDAPFVDAVAVGRAVIANPDLVARWKDDRPENDPRPEFFYAFSAEGYTDYPTLDLR